MIDTLQANTISDLAFGKQPDLMLAMRMTLVEIQSGLTPAIAQSAPKVFQLRKRMGDAELLKLTVFVLKAFQDSLKIKEGMEAPDLIECAEEILSKYSHDSLKDVMLALKQAKREGHKFYNQLSQPTVMEILHKYFEEKSQLLKYEHQELKHGRDKQSAIEQLPPALLDKFLQVAHEALPAKEFDEEEYRQFRAKWVAEQTTVEAPTQQQPNTSAA